MIKEITNSIKAALYQRVSSPLYGTYICSWLIYNWEAVLPLIFGSKVFDQRVIDFKSRLSPEATGFEYDTITIPLVITFVLLVVQPLLQRFIFIYTEWNRSEGLKKRDKYSSETMLTLEQSNELRSSVQKFQQFHQEVLKNKEEEINEYKRQLESKDNTVNSINDSNLKLIEQKTELDSEKSALSVELATVRGQLADLESNYHRLGKILSNSRRAKRDLSARINTNGWFVNSSAIKELPQLVVLGANPSNPKRAAYLQNMKNVSTNIAWLSACNEVAIHGFSQVWSFNMADDYFTEIIRPNLQSMDEEQIHRLITVMENNGQISGRNRAASDMKIVRATLESRVA
ncbi:TPA: hypothetical protein ACMDOQ_003572 [Vibrio cholerae]|uniref:hypothetical protein n=1 Tax=Vibrio cholerae TaxID=666 RepID=UPI001158CD35|nr:hypothetical protein [Vibrio cholerae]EGR3866439.1 hypothetical protein [Vibrio cholerae]EJK2283428.1 hypothetical protein [Vibrio cholerae]EJL6950272.1 hypothetical protein [Vibrio cholerae]TQO63333.1 hypothetical protein FLM08_13125 [Vibrio cholerae]GIB53136.1 hypothetical protein VCSRO187_3484 [Vibrio cholerae]